MATKPDDRYASCRALADDVERLGGRRAGLGLPRAACAAARRWAKRNRTVVTAAAVALAAGLAGLGAVAAVQTQAKDSLAAKNLELTLANALVTKVNSDLAAANTKVEARFELAREAIRSFQDGVNQDDMLKGETLKGLRNTLLRSAAGFYEKLEKLLKGQTDRRSRAILAQSYYELGDLTDKIGIKPEALAVHKKALTIRRELASGPDADANAKLDLARSLIATGLLAEATDDKPGAISVYEEARAQAKPLAEGSVATDAARDVLGISHHRVGRVLLETGKPAEALESYRRALAIQQKLADDNPAATEFRTRLADSHNNIGVLQYQTGHPAEALESFRRALAIQQKLADDNPAVTEFQNDWRQPQQHRPPAFAHRQDGRGARVIPPGVGDPAEAGRRQPRRHRIPKTPGGQPPHYRPTAVGYRPDGRGAGVVPPGLDDPAEAGRRQPRRHRTSAAVWRTAGLHRILQLNSGRLAEASAELAREAAIRERLAVDNPSVPGYRSTLANCLNNTASLLLRLGRPSDARFRASGPRRCSRPWSETTQRPRSIGAGWRKAISVSARLARPRVITSALPTIGSGPSRSAWRSPDWTASTRSFMAVATRPWRA